MTQKFRPLTAEQRQEFEYEIWDENIFSIFTGILRLKEK